MPIGHAVNHNLACVDVLLRLQQFGVHDGKLGDLRVPLEQRGDAAGEPVPELALGAQFSADALRDLQGVPIRDDWHDIVGELDLWAYLQPTDDSTNSDVACLSAEGGWNSKDPLQITI